MTEEVIRLKLSELTIVRVKLPTGWVAEIPVGKADGILNTSVLGRSLEAGTMRSLQELCKAIEVLNEHDATAEIEFLIKPPSSR